MTSKLPFFFFPGGDRTISTSFLSLKKTRRRKLNWLIELAPNWLRVHKTSAGHVWPAQPALRFQLGVTALEKCFLLLQNVMLYSGHIVPCTKADGTLKSRKPVPNPSPGHHKGHSACFRQLLLRRKEIKTKFGWPGAVETQPCQRQHETLVKMHLGRDGPGWQQRAWWRRRGDVGVHISLLPKYAPVAAAHWTMDRVKIQTKLALSLRR